MARRIASLVRSRPVLGGAMLVLSGVAVALAASQAVLWLRWASWATGAEAVAAARSRSEPASSAVLSFGYRGRTRFLTVPIDPAERLAAHALSTEGVFGQQGPLLDAYLGTLVRTQSRTASVESMVVQLRMMRAEFGLDDDEYVELMARAVQDVPYGTPAPTFGLSVQLAAEGKAVCSDKSVLLAALLLHEGYDTGLWTLDGARHVAVAVRASGGGLGDTGYAYVETTRRAYVGDVPAEYVTGPRPRLVRVGGRGRYHADLETAFILQQLRVAESQARVLAPYHRYADTASGRWRQYYAAKASEQVAASRLAVLLSHGADDRERAYVLLAR